jgi:hypothetical protein
LVDQPSINSIFHIFFFYFYLYIMSSVIEDENTPFEGGGVPIPVVATSREEGEISEEEDDINADFIRNATTVITTASDPPRAALTRLTFGLPEHNFRGTEAPVSPPATSILGNNTWQAAAYSLRISLGLAEESIELHASIKSAFYGN